MVAALRLVGVRKSFDGFVALDDAEFEAQAGEVHALLGRERGRQVLADERRGRPLHAGSRADPRQRRRGRAERSARRAPPAASAWCTRNSSWCGHSPWSKTCCSPIGAAGIAPGVRAIERQIEQQAAELGFEIDPETPHRRTVDRRTPAGRDHQGAARRRPHSHSRRTDRGADRRGSGAASHHGARARRRRGRRRAGDPQARRGDRLHRPRDGDARRARGGAARFARPPTPPN